MRWRKPKYKAFCTRCGAQLVPLTELEATEFDRHTGKPTKMNQILDCPNGHGAVTARLTWT